MYIRLACLQSYRYSALARKRATTRWSIYFKAKIICVDLRWLAVTGQIFPATSLAILLRQHANPLPPPLAKDFLLIAGYEAFL